MEEWFSSQWVLAIAVVGLFAVGLVITLYLRFRKPEPEVFTEGTPLKLPCREGPHVRVPYNTEVGGLIKLDNETFCVTNIHHDFSPAGCYSYAQLEPVVISPSRWELLMEDDE